MTRIDDNQQLEVQETVDEAMDKFVEEQTAFLRDMVEGWIRTDYERKYYSDDCLKKVKKYLSPKVEERSDDEGR